MKLYNKVMKRRIIFLIVAAVVFAAAFSPVHAAAQAHASTGKPNPAPSATSTPEAPTPDNVTFDEAGNLIFLATPTLFVRSFTPVSVDYEVPLIRQNQLTYLGTPTARGCTAASVAMVLSYWQRVDESNLVLDAQQIIDINSQQGQFYADSGLSIENVKDELRQLGYEIAILRNGTKETLLEALDTFGPVAVLCKLGWKPAGANHMTVITGYNAESDRLLIHDPNIAQPLDIAYSTFDAIWGIDYSTARDGSLRRAFFIIVPEDFEIGETPKP